MTTNPTSESSPSKPTLCLQEKDEILKVFNQFDANGDGKITGSELGDALKTLDSEVSSDELQRGMTDLKSDNDGFIIFEEFAAFCRSRSDDDTELRDAFKLYDQNRNGLISATELHCVLNRLKMSCSIEDCHRMIKSVDSDGDGNVNFDEFKQMMTNTASKASVNT